MIKKFRVVLKSSFVTMSFNPSWFWVLINPFWLYRRALTLALLELSPFLRGKVFDFGSGSQPYRSMVKNCTSYVGLEYDKPENRERKVAISFKSSNTYLDNLVLARLNKIVN